MAHEIHSAIAIRKDAETNLLCSDAPTFEEMNLLFASETAGNYLFDVLHKNDLQLCDRAGNHPTTGAANWDATKRFVPFDPKAEKALQFAEKAQQKATEKKRETAAAKARFERCCKELYAECNDLFDCTHEWNDESWVLWIIKIIGEQLMDQFNLRVLTDSEMSQTIAFGREA